MLERMTERLEADAGHIEMTFPFFVMKKAPVSGVESLMDYGATPHRRAPQGAQRDCGCAWWCR